MPISELRAGQADTRILRLRVDRVADAIWNTWRDTLPWAIGTALLCSSAVPWFGQVPFLRCMMFIAIVALGAIIAAIPIKRCFKERSNKLSAHELSAWSRDLLWLQAATSATWGANSWLLWVPGHLVNHMFIAISCQADLNVVIASARKCISDQHASACADR